MSYIIDLKEHLFRNVGGYSSQNSIFVDPEPKYHTNIYNIILIFLVWTAPKFLPTNVVNVLVFSKLILFRITCFSLNSWHFFHKQHFFNQPQYCLTFLWIQLQILLRCCLIHITIIKVRHILYLSIFVPVSRPKPSICFSFPVSFSLSLII